MAIIVGPSIGTAKSKVMFAVDGLEAKIWGLRDDLPRTVVRDEGDSDCSDEAEDSDPEEAEDESCEPEDFDCPSEPEDSDAEGDNSDVASSRSSTSSRRSSPTPPPSTPSERIHVSKSISSSVQDHASQQQKIRTADQLLSRTLAIADAEGRGMATELGELYCGSYCSFLCVQVFIAIFQHPPKRTSSYAPHDVSPTQPGYLVQTLRNLWNIH